jgi:hypothetical protein
VLADEFGESVVHFLRKGDRSLGIRVNLHTWRVQAEHRYVDTCCVHLFKALLNIGKSRAHVFAVRKIEHERMLGFFAARYGEVLGLAPVAFSDEVLLDSDHSFLWCVRHDSAYLLEGRRSVFD